MCLQGIFNTLDRAGQLVEQTIEQLYSEAAGKFLADRFVTGTCPKCQYEVTDRLTDRQTVHALLLTVRKSTSIDW